MWKNGLRALLSVVLFASFLCMVPHVVVSETSAVMGGAITSAVWHSGLTAPSIPVGGSDRIVLTIENTGSYGGNLVAEFSISPTTAPIIVNDFTVNVPANQSVVVPATVVNTGTTTDVNFQVICSLWNGNNEHQGNDWTLGGVATRGYGIDTSLTVTTQDKNDLGISGINVTIKYGDSSVSHTTYSGTWTFDLGQYSGSVEVSSSATNAYYATDNNIQVIGGTGNTYPISLIARGPTGEAPFNLSVYLPYIFGGVIGAVGIGVGVYFYAKKRDSESGKVEMGNGESSET